jgi:hypothetical protein
MTPGRLAANNYYRVVSLEHKPELFYSNYSYMKKAAGYHVSQIKLCTNKCKYYTIIAKFIARYCIFTKI